MRRVLILLVELCLVGLAVFVADWLQGVVDVIPRWLIHLPEVSYDRGDFWTVLKYFIVVHAIVLGAGQLFLGPWSAGDARRTVNEIFLLAVAFATSALIIFVTTTVAFDPQFIVAILLVGVVFFLVLYFVFALRDTGPMAALGAFFAALVRRIFSVPGVLAMLFALSPGILAKLFVSDRDVANVITQIRIQMSTQEQGDWTVENAVGDEKFRQPILVQFPPGVADTMVVLERHGRLLRLPWRRQGESQLLLDISAKVGEVEVENSVRVPAKLADLPRVGVTLALVPGLDRATWFGRGPHESYEDRKTGAAEAVDHRSKGLDPEHRVLDDSAAADLALPDFELRLGNVIFGGDDNDTINGGEGDDLLYGNRGSDRLQGGPGNDTQRGGKGDDLLEGGLDSDVFIIETSMGIKKDMLSARLDGG